MKLAVKVLRDYCAKEVKSHEVAESYGGSSIGLQKLTRVAEPGVVIATIKNDLTDAHGEVPVKTWGKKLEWCCNTFRLFLNGMN